MRFEKSRVYHDCFDLEMCLVHTKVNKREQDYNIMLKEEKK